MVKNGRFDVYSLNSLFCILLTAHMISFVYFLTTTNIVRPTLYHMSNLSANLYKEISRYERYTSRLSGIYRYDDFSYLIDSIITSCESCSYSRALTQQRIIQQPKQTTTLGLLNNNNKNNKLRYMHIYLDIVILEWELSQLLLSVVLMGRRANRLVSRSLRSH